MKTYIAAGIGDMMAVDALLTQEEKSRITEIYWGCRFGKHLVPLMENNPSYPNLRLQHVISDQVGMEAMKQVDGGAVNFWHFRPDFSRNYQIGLSLFDLRVTDVEPINIAGIFQDANRTFTSSSFLDNATPYSHGGYMPRPYSVVHLPTSTRPRGDIAQIDDGDWDFIGRNDALNLKYIISDHEPDDIPLDWEDYELLINPDLSHVINLIKGCQNYYGCDSFCAILASKRLPKENLFVKSHKPNIQSDILTNVWQQRYFQPHSPRDIAYFYKPYIGM